MLAAMYPSTVYCQQVQPQVQLFLMDKEAAVAGISNWQQAECLQRATETLINTTAAPNPC